LLSINHSQRAQDRAVELVEWGPSALSS